MKHLKDCRNLPNVPHNTILGEKIGDLINHNIYWGLIRFGRLPQMFHLIRLVERLGTQSIPMNHWDLIGFSIFPMFLIIYWEGLKKECFTSLLPMIFLQGHTSQSHVACLTKVCLVNRRPRLNL